MDMVNGLSNTSPYHVKIEDSMVVPNLEATLGLTYAPSSWGGNVRFTGAYQMIFYPGLAKGFYDADDLSFDGAITRVEFLF